MPETTQFCVGLEDKPGTLTKLCRSLREHEVNIDALFVSSENDTAWVNFVASPVSKAERTLMKCGYKFFTEEVVAIRLESRPGEIERIASRLADAGVNINYIYGSSSAGNPSTVVLHTVDVQQAIAALGALVA